MNKSIYTRVVFILSMVLASVSLYAANDEAQYNELTKEYKLNEDGSYSLHVRKEITYLTHKSFNSLYGETFIVYNPKREELKINECYTTQADGTVIKAPKNAFNEVLPAAAAGAPAYNHLREMVVTHTGLELGATVLLDYTVTTKPASGGVTPFDIKEIIQESSPIKTYTISIEAPKSLGLRYDLVGSNMKPKVEGDKVTFKFKNVASKPIEYYQPENGTAPVLLATTMSEGFIADKYSKSSSSAFAKDLAGDILASKSGKDDDVTALARAVASGLFADSKLPFLYQDNTERDMNSVFESGYATSMEKVAMFKALLDSQGIAYKMVVVYPDNVDDDMLTFTTLKKILFAVNGKYYSVDNSAFSVSMNNLKARASFDDYYTLVGGDFEELDFDSSISEVEKNHNATITKALASKLNGYIVVYLPKELNITVGGVSMTHLPTDRVSPVELSSKVNESATWELTLKDGIELQVPEFEVEMKESFGTLSISLEDRGDVVVLKRSISVDKQTISPKEYKKFREFVKVWSSSKGSKLLFK